MSMTDPIADMLTRIRNANAIRRTSVDVPRSRLKKGIADVLKREGYIVDYLDIDAGAQSMLRLESGPILVAKRFPLHSINVSYDNGVNWDKGTVVDYPVQANGFMVEVEPGVVLCTYQNAGGGMPLLGQLIRVTDAGLVPLPLEK